MVLSKEQAVEIKKQIIGQVQNSQMENKDEIIKSITEMDEVELEGFLKANNIPVSGVEGSGGGAEGSGSGGSGSEGSCASPTGECIFCSIVNKNVPSHILEENDKAVAILELNPVSEGHSIVLPKDHISVDKLSKSVMALAQKIAKRMKKKLKCEDVKIETSNFQGHSMINVIPIYEGGKMEKKKAEEKELVRMKKKLEIKKRGSRIKKVKIETVGEDDLSKLPKMKFRIP
jgi:histidine triad (HIT) family protein